MPTQIQTSSNLPFYSEQVNMDGTFFTLNFKWNRRDSAWYLDIYTEEGAAVLLGHKLVVNFSPTRRLASGVAPRGEIFIVELSGTDDEANFDDLGTRVIASYFTHDEMVTLLNG